MQVCYLSVFFSIKKQCEFVICQFKNKVIVQGLLPISVLINKVTVQGLLSGCVLTEKN